MFIHSNYAAPKTATVSSTQNVTSALPQDGQTAPISLRQTFARISRDISEILQGVTPCAERLYAWLLQQAKAGKPQEVHLKDFAEATQLRKRGAYSLAHIRRALDELLNVGLVEQVFQYSGKIFKLIAHDSRSFLSNPEMESSQPLTETSKELTSNPHASVPVNRERSERSTDIPPTHPVSTNERGKDGGNPEGLVEALESLPIAIQTEILQEVEQTLERSLNPQIRKTLLHQTINGIRNALNAYQEAKQRQTIKNPLGWLTAAVRDRFTPNAIKPNHSNIPSANSIKTPPEGFREWLALAQPLGIALNGGFMDGIFHVHTVDAAVPWDEIRETWPLSLLHQLQSQGAARPLPTPFPVLRPSSPSPAISNIWGQLPDFPQNLQTLNDPDQRQNALARLRLKYKQPAAQLAVLKECEHWGFEIGPNGPQEANC